MTYELNICTSSLGVFTSLWSSHWVGLLVYLPEGTKILYISDNLASHTTSPNDCVDGFVNQKIIKDLFFLTVSAFLLTYRKHIIPPHLRDNNDFMSYFRGWQSLFLLSFFKKNIFILTPLFSMFTITLLFLLLYFLQHGIYLVWEKTMIFFFASLHLMFLQDSEVNMVSWFTWITCITIPFQLFADFWLIMLALILTTQKLQKVYFCCGY